MNSYSYHFAQAADDPFSSESTLDFLEEDTRFPFQTYAHQRRWEEERRKREHEEWSQGFAEAAEEEPFGKSAFPNASRAIEYLPNVYARDALYGGVDMLRNYGTMILADTIGADKYYHCKGNCEATQRGIGGKHAATLISEARELYGQWAGDPVSDKEEDQRANRHGRDAPAGTNCEDRCSRFRPSYLRKKWW